MRATMLLGSIWLAVTGCDDKDDDTMVPPDDTGATQNTVDTNTLPTPVLTSMAPDWGGITTPVTLTGTDFGATQGTGTVMFGSTAATVTTWADTSISVTVPDIFPGMVDVTVTTDGGISPATSFRVTLPPAVYAVSDGSVMNVRAFSFDSMRGSLTEIAGSPYGTTMTPGGFGGCATTLWLNQATRRLFVGGASQIAVYDIDPTTGALSAVTGSPFDSGLSETIGLTTDATGTRLFAPSYHSAEVGVFSIANNGALTAITNSPFTTASSYGYYALLREDEKFLYLSNDLGQFEAFSVATDGALTALTNSPYEENTNAYAAGLRPGYDQLFIPDGSVGLRIYDLDATTGEPTAIAGSPFAENSTPGTLHHMAFLQDGSRVYVGADGAGYIQAFDLAVDGTPTELAASPFDLTAEHSDVACLSMSYDGSVLFVLDEAAPEVGVYRVQTDGSLVATTNSPFAFTETSPSGMVSTF